MATIESVGGFKATLYRIEFNGESREGESVLLEFVDPTACKAVVSSKAVEAMPEEQRGPAYDVLEVLAVARDGKDDSQWRKDLRSLLEPPSPDRAVPILLAKVEDVLVSWRPGRAVVQAPPQRMEFVLPALAEFAYYEGQLRRLEDEIAAAWPDAHADAPVASQASQLDARQRQEVCRRMTDVFQRRIRHVRIESHLYEPDEALSPVGQQLGEALREKAGVEDRLESIDGKLEVFEYLYELAVQRVSDHTQYSHGMIVEVAIVVLLLFEVGLMVLECYFSWFAE